MYQISVLLIIASLRVTGHVDQPEQIWSFCRPRRYLFFDYLASLHWLPMESWIQYKLASLCYNSLNSTASVTWLNCWQFTHQPASYALLLILPFSVFPLCARTRLVRDLCLMVHRLSGTVSLAKLDHQAHSHLLNHLWNLTASSYPIDSVCVCVCVCVHARSRKFVLTVFCFLPYNGLCAPVWRNNT